MACKRKVFTDQVLVFRVFYWLLKNVTVGCNKLTLLHFNYIRNCGFLSRTSLCHVRKIPETSSLASCGVQHNDVENDLFYFW